VAVGAGLILESAVSEGHPSAGRQNSGDAGRGEETGGSPTAGNGDESRDSSSAGNSPKATGRLRLSLQSLARLYGLKTELSKKNCPTRSSLAGFDFLFH